MNKGIKWLVSTPAILAGTTLVFIMLLTVADVILRFFFNAPITGSSEITQRFVIMGGYLGIGWCALKDQHTKVDMLTCKLPLGVQRALFVVNHLVVIAMSFLIAWNSFKQALFVKRMNVQSQLIGIPNYPFYMVISVAYVILIVAVLWLMVRTITGKPTQEGKCEP